MSMLSQDTARKIVDALSGPLPQHREAAAAWERGEPLEWRYAHFDSPGNVWRQCIRQSHIGMEIFNHTPNWQSAQIEFRSPINEQLNTQ